MRDCLQGYNILACPQLEYTGPVWDLELEKDQRRAARWTTSNYNNPSSVTAMVDSLGWRTWKRDGQMGVFVFFFKIVYVCGTHSLTLICRVTLPEYIQPATSRVKKTLEQCHSLVFHQLHTSMDFYKYAFSTGYLLPSGISYLKLLMLTRPCFIKVTVTQSVSWPALQP